VRSEGDAAGSIIRGLGAFFLYKCASPVPATLLIAGTYPESRISLRQAGFPLWVDVVEKGLAIVGEQ